MHTFSAFLRGNIMLANNKYLSRGILAIILSALSTQVFADDLNGANTAWILTSTALVLFMTIPGLSLFYGGLVRSKNALSVLMQCFAITCMASIIWFVYGYGLAFGDGGSMNKWIGSVDWFMSNVTRDSLSGTIPESVFAMFQMTFAIITPALIVGGFAERMKFSAMLLFLCMVVHDISFLLICGNIIIPTSFIVTFYNTTSFY